MKIRTSFMIFGGLFALSSSGHLFADTLALSIPLPDPLPQLNVLTLLVGIHLLGMCFGLGGATMLDLWIFRWMRRGASQLKSDAPFTSSATRSLLDYASYGFQALVS
jgi:hypothetical protein